MCSVHIPSRYVIMVMIFGCYGVTMMTRVNISVNIVAMDSFNWTAYERANVLSSVYWGDFITNVIGGPIVERWGPRKIVFITILGSSIFSFLSVPAAKFSPIAMIVVRLALGICSGFVLPTLHFLISRWAIPTERGRFLGALSFGTIGIFICWSTCGWVVERFGWEWGFYVYAIVSLIYCLIWLYVGYDSPETHPRITASEKQYINNGIDKYSTKKKLPTPYRRILTSLPFLSFCIVNFGSGWGAYFVINIAPNYIAKALDYKISSVGMLSGFIYLAKSISSLIFGVIGDMLLKYKLMSVNVLRKIAVVVSHILPGCAFLMLLTPDQPAIFYVCMIMLSMTLNGALTLSVLSNGHDLAKNFAGTVNGFANSLLTVAAILTPPVAAYFTKEDETNPDNWIPVFYLGGAVFILSGLQFMVLGSTQRQPWDEVADDTVKE